MFNDIHTPWRIKFIGRGGQGVTTALKILAKANFDQGKDVQCFPCYGGVRRGAPVEGYLRIADQGPGSRPIESRGRFKVADVLVAFHPALVNKEVLSSQLNDGGFLLMNTAGNLINVSSYTKYFSAAIDATSISITASLGSISNLIVGPGMLGALSALAPEIAPQRELVAAINSMPEIDAKNSLHAFMMAYKEAISAAIDGQSGLASRLSCDGDESISDIKGVYHG